MKETDMFVREDMTDFVGAEEAKRKQRKRVESTRINETVYD